MSSRQPNGLIIHPSRGVKNWVGYVINKDGGYGVIGSYTVANIQEWHQYGISYNDATKIGKMIFSFFETIRNCFILMARSFLVVNNLIIGG